MPYALLLQLKESVWFDPAIALNNFSKKLIGDIDFMRQVS